MMRFASVLCHGCSTRADHAVYQDEHMAQCPKCQQWNPVPSGAIEITGRCGRCNKPVDDHTFYEDFMIACPSKEKK